MDGWMDAWMDEYSRESQSILHSQEELSKGSCTREVIFELGLEVVLWVDERGSLDINIFTFGGGGRRDGRLEMMVGQEARQVVKGV